MNGLSTPTDGDDRGYSLQVGALATANAKSLLHVVRRRQGTARFWVSVGVTQRSGGQGASGVSFASCIVD